MKILDNTKSLSTLVSDNSNGLGQIQPLSCTVTEELNGIYELDFTVNVNDKHYNDLKNSGLVKVTVGDGSEQIFRIYKIDEPINMISSVHCQHITYDLSKVVVKPFTATGAVNIKNQLVSNMLGSYPFSTWTDITNTTSTFTNDIPRYFRECLGGYEGSVLDVLRPEYEWDNLTVKLHARRGSDNGVRISYGKNLIDYSQEQNNENVYDGVYGYAVVDEVTYKADSYYNKTGATYPRILNVDFSSDYESGQIPTPSELLQKATTYAQNNSIEVPSINIKIDFIPLWQTEEYKNILPLERVSLGDTVHVYFDKLNVEASSRVIKTQWNVLTNKYDSIELGDAKANLNTIINDSVSTAVDEAVSNMDIDVGYIEDDLNDMAKLIINGLGLYFTRESLPSGGYRFYLHNAPRLEDSDVRYYMSASGLMVTTDGGQTWTTGYNPQTGEMILQALSTITLRALEIYGSTITFGDVNDKYITASVYSSNNVAQGVSFDGSGTVRFQPQEQFLVYNKDPDSNKSFNMFIMNRRGQNSNYLSLDNYDDTQNFLLANRIQEQARNANGTMNNILLVNNATASGTLYLANSFYMIGYASTNTAYIRNFKPRSSTLQANNINFNATTTGTSVSLANYVYNLGQEANQYVLSSNATDGNVANIINKYNSYDANSLMLVGKSSGNTVTLMNRYNNNDANSLVFEGKSSGNTVTLANMDSSGEIKNSLTMASSQITTLWSMNDLRLFSRGAVRINANTNQDGSSYGGDQDIVFTGTTMHFYFTSKFSFHTGGGRYDCDFSGMSVGTSYPLYVKRVS